MFTNLREPRFTYYSNDIFKILLRFGFSLSLNNFLKYLKLIGDDDVKIRISGLVGKIHSMLNFGADFLGQKVLCAFVVIIDAIGQQVKHRHLS